MRIHSNKIDTWETISDTLTREKGAGRIGAYVVFKTLRAHNSATHAYAYEVQLESTVKLDGDGRRFGNSGSYGAGDNYTATYDEWGWLLSALYDIDPDMMCGRVSYPTYADRFDFHLKTGESFNIPAFAKWADDPYPFVQGKNSTGRRGYGRLDECGRGGYISQREIDAAVAYYEATPAQRRKMSRPWLKYEPRTREDMLTFAHLAGANLA